MAKADLHVHSKYSDYPSTWAHKAYRSPESFTEPELVYQQAKSRGMDFVTLTDHDDIRGSLELVHLHPDDCFISCEITTFFPEDQCKIHILVYGITATQYTQCRRASNNLYDLRDYIIAEDIAYSVAHATYDQDGRLSFEHIEKLVVLFDIFEIINGGSSAQNNLLLHSYLQTLDEEKLTALASKHDLTPMSDDPWIKGFTGGSDDHCGILIGTAFTQAEARDVGEFLSQLRNKHSLGNGLHGSFESYATGVIKHIHDYRIDRDSGYHKTKMNDFLELFFDNSEGNLIKRFKKSQSLRYLKKKNTKTHKALHALLQQISQDQGKDIAAKIPQTYVHIADMHDEMFGSVVTAISKHLPNGDVFKAFNKLATLFPMTLLATPFIGAMRHQVLKADIKRGLIQCTRHQYTEKALWFTDTIDDLNGVSITLHQIAAHSVKQGYQMKLVTCVNEAKLNSPLPKNCLNFHPVKQVSLPGYETQKIGFPSLLNVMRRLVYEQADQIIISTPGPLGLAAMICGKLMDIPVKTVYHTDFAEQILKMTEENMLANLADTCVNLFYKQSDRVFVPSQFYIDKLIRAGFEPSRLSIFPRGIDLDLYRPALQTRDLARRHQLHGSFTLLFAGRISEDKNLSLLARVFQDLNRRKPGMYNLVIAGDGPDLSALKQTLTEQSNVLFTGRLNAQELVEWYRASDLLVFPSHTDTFGMVVLEAQACGLPCLVTATGGPKEIIDPNTTGHVVHSDECEDWISLIHQYRRLKNSNPEDWLALKTNCARHVHTQNNWQPVFEAVLGEACLLPVNEVSQLADANSAKMKGAAANEAKGAAARELESAAARELESAAARELESAAAREIKSAAATKAENTMTDTNDDGDHNQAA
ncbi:glycosyltransferase [Arenicella xantha]|uniref:Glycosyltransferase involved in cell wall biosynthesis n=1 Tax=Arenicella xantha TaxID=644221 RepID=A0A395JG80_9GAMM|nr:glycosyltransferase [Arenicella xantha]RBP48455.1 glycosyltransferase involved in cell wall biosynthesis [Arenicella xantha]